MELQHVRRGLQSGDLKRVAQVVRTLQGEGLSERDIYRLALAGDPELTLEAWGDLATAALESKLDAYYPQKSLLGFEAIAYAQASGQTLFKHTHLTTNNNHVPVQPDEARTLVRSPLVTIFVYVRPQDCERG